MHLIKLSAEGRRESAGLHILIQNCKRCVGIATQWYNPIKKYVVEMEEEYLTNDNDEEKCINVA